MRWARENDFDALIGASVDSLSWVGVNRDQVVAFIKALIAHESSFNPQARRREAGGNDSVGLMQVRYSTAKGLGFPGSIDGLFDPGTNIFLGTRLVNSLFGALGADMQAVASAYNGGQRPQYGFGKRLTKPMTLCLARDADGNCQRTFDAAPGQFGNQPYVDAVMHVFDYFWKLPGGPPAPDTPSQSGAATGVGVGLALGISALLFFMGRRKVRL